jgi:uncharacterized membrane protein
MSAKERVMESLPRVPLLFNVALTGLMTALVCVATMFFQIDVPFTQGYINAGEIVIYVTALLFGPIIGGVAGGVGSLLANILVGSTQYALAVLLIKGFEGFLVGFLGYKFRLTVQKWWKPLNIIMGVGVAGLVLYVGVNYFSGLAEIYGGIRPWWWITGLFTNYLQWGWWYVLVNISGFVWLIAAVYIGILVLYFGFRVDASTGWSVLAILAGGFFMILGYLFYEQLFVGAVSMSIISNVAQILLGIMIAIPIVVVAMKKLPKEIFVATEER